MTWRSPSVDATRPIRAAVDAPTARRRPRDASLPLQGAQRPGRSSGAGCWVTTRPNRRRCAPGPTWAHGHAQWAVFLRPRLVPGHTPHVDRLASGLAIAPLLPLWEQRMANRKVEKLIAGWKAAN